ncbi:L2 protein [Molossus molossus papillomavirus 1]|uniref:Minor capsid protein L2 n=1 Tax=Molossus molossus papillomavirus 1 TaxID=1959848 RepID=A0A2H4GSS7_9PAPI|nr:L2 protein [Molossus molossus papillomavirus 1]AQR57911.1 L2 protein [Molossus molossus papillomavirus 1]
MSRAGRKRRAAAEDIYKHCKQFGTCPPDVVNKIENNTIADRILKWLSPFLYFGGAGISSGKGTGTVIPLERPFGGFGSDLGVAPAESGVTVGVRPIPVVPAEPPVGIDPGGEFLELEPLLPVRPTPEVPGTVDGPVDTGVNVTPVVPDVLEVNPVNIEPVEPPVTVSTSLFDNPTFEVSITASTTTGESSAVDHVFVGERAGGTNIGGGEEIPLQTFRETIPDDEFQVEDTGFTTSTPQEGRVRGDRGYLYNRRLVQQVEVPEIEFLEEPRTLITFENPVYNEQDLTMIFENELNEVTRTPPRAAPHRDFTDIKYLGRQLFSRAPKSGRVRVSRVGMKGTLRTRSGVQIGSHVHYYQDLSSILPAEEVELLPLGEVTGTEEIITGEGETPFVEVNLNDAADSIGLEPSNDFEVIENTDFFGDVTTTMVPDPTKHRSFYPDHLFGFGGPNVTVDYPVTNIDVRPTVVPEDRPWIPYYSFNDNSTDFFYEPCLYGKRRKRCI